MKPRANGSHPDETLVNMVGFLLPTFLTFPEGVPLVVPRGLDRRPRELGSTTLQRNRWVEGG